MYIMEFIMLVVREVRRVVLFFFIIEFMVSHLGMNVGDGGRNRRLRKVIMLLTFFFVFDLFWFILRDLFF